MHSYKGVRHRVRNTLTFIIFILPYIHKNYAHVFFFIVGSRFKAERQTDRQTEGKPETPMVLKNGKGTNNTTVHQPACLTLHVHCMLQGAWTD